MVRVFELDGDGGLGNYLHSLHGRLKSWLWIEGAQPVDVSVIIAAGGE